MTQNEFSSVAPPASPADEASAFRSWLEEHSDDLAELRVLHVEADNRVDLLRRLQKTLHEAGWATLGWPESVGGRGGNILHRAAIYEELALAGYPPRFVYEHLEVLLPSLVKYGHPDLMAELLPRMLRGDETWSQGFSEPGAGSDLASLRTRATRDGDHWVLNGHKIWTSWSKWAKWCLLIARTGTPESRHRGLTMFVVDLEAPGVTLTPINQSNGSPELAEIFFENVTVPANALVGEVDGGWEVAMYLLSCERGSYAWQRNTYIAQRLAEFAPMIVEPSDMERLGNSVADVFAMRSRSWSTMVELAADGRPGPQSAVNKAMLGDTEQYLFETADRAHPSGYMWAPTAREEVMQEELIFTHAIPIWGGTRQIQNITIFRQLISGQNSTPTDEYLDAALAAMTDPAGANSGLETLGFADVVADLDDPDNRRAVSAVFQAAGRSGEQTTALATLLSSVLGESATLALATENLGGQSTRVIVDAAATGASTIVLDSADGWIAVDAEAVSWLDDVQFLSKDRLVAGVADTSAAISFDPETVERATALGRWALACETLGAVDAMFEAAAQHTADREQFGAPLNSFQAVQFMLAEAHIARTSLREVCDTASRTLAPVPTTLAKLIAGRVGRRVGKETLQALGAIGFTEEHPHHGWYHRALTIDAVLGRSVELARQVGADLVRTGVVPVGVEIADLPGHQAASSAARSR